MTRTTPPIAQGVRGTRARSTPSAWRIGAELETAAELAHAMHREGDSWSLVLAGHEHDDVGIGERARLTLEVRGHEPVEMEVVVVWRRICRGPGLPAALGLRLEGVGPETVARLRYIATGQFEDDVRDVLRARASAKHAQ